MITRMARYVRQQHVGLLALLVAMSGSAYAMALPRNSVGTPQLKKNAVIGSKVKNGSLTKADLKAGTIPAAPREVYWALVSASGNILRQRGGVSSALETNGATNAQYRMTLPVAVENCSFQATAGDPTPIGSNEFVYPRVPAIAPSTQSTKTVTVQLYIPNDGAGDDAWIYVQDSFWFAAYCS